MDDKSMEFYVYSRECALKKYHGGAAESVILPATFRDRPVTKILEGAFKGNSNLKHLLIPSTITEIQASAFEGCEALEVVTCCSGDMEYSKLENATEAVLNLILANEFRSCLNATEIGNRAFYGASSIQCVEFYGQQVTLGEEAFSHSGIETLLAPSAENGTIGKACFAHCPKLVMCHLLQAKVAVPQDAFRECTALKVFNCRQLTGVGERAFSGCSSLTSVREVPEGGLACVGDRAFSGCPDKLDLTPFGIKKRKSSPQKPKTKAQTETQKEESAETKQNLRQDFKERLDRMAKKIEVKDYGFPLFFSKETFTDAPPTIIKGRFDQVNGEFQFAEDNLHFPPFCCQKSHLDPLLRFFCDCSSTVALRLEHRDDGVYVCTGIRHVEQPVKREESISEDLLDVIIARLYHRSAADLPLVSRENDLELFYQICKDSIPHRIQKAIEKEKETLALHPMRGSEESKHATTAWKMLLNVDFSPPDWGQLPVLAEARAQLDRDLYGMDDVKEHLLGVIAEIKRTSKMPRYGLLFVGAAGTGKSASVQAFADAINLPFVQVDCSTIGADRDASIGERLWGTERIYNNARYGMIFQKMIEHRSSSYVLHLAEVDLFPEIGNALRSLLDRSGSAHEAFVEQFLPTEGIFCIASCNSTKNIPQPLLDRFHVIELASYTRDEKKQILQTITLPKVKEDKGIPNMSLSGEAVEYLSGMLTEPGARDIEKAVETIASDYIVRCADTKNDPNPVKIYDVQDIQKLFPQAPKVSLVAKPGQAEFVYQTGYGPQFGVIQVMAVPGTGNLQILGALDDTQCGYCRVAYEAVRCIAFTLLQRVDMTIMALTPVTGSENHVGLACFVAILSLLTGTALTKVCFCGGVDLTGNAYRTSPLGPVLNAVSRSDKVLYAPYGAEEPLKGNGMICQSCEARVLFELAAAQSQKTRGAS